MTAMPWGQKKRRSEMIQSQTVTPPFAAMEGTTLRLKTATTKRRTRSQRPRTRFRWGVSAALAEENVVACVDKKQIPRFARNENMKARLLPPALVWRWKPFLEKRGAAHERVYRVGQSQALQLGREGGGGDRAGATVSTAPRARLHL